MAEEVKQDGGWGDALAESWAKVEGGDNGTPEVTTEAKHEAPASSPEVVAESSAGNSAKYDRGGEPDRARDEKGRFAPKEAGEASKGTPAPRASESGVREVAAGAPAGPPPAAAPAAPPASVSEQLRAPQSWTPAEREEFAKASPAVQKAALRREAEITRTLSESAEARKGYDSYKQTVAPYEHMFRAAGVTPHQAVGNVLQKYAALSTGPVPARADIVAELVSNFIGTDESSINVLAAALDRRIRGGQAPAPAQGVDPNQVQAMIRQQLEQERQQATRESAISVFGQFEATAPEYLNDVRDDMGIVLGAWERQNPGRAVTVDVFQQAYDKACLLHPEISVILKQKEAAKAAANAQASTQRAKVAGSSVKTQPGGPPAPPPLGDDTRSHMAAAWERAEGR